MHDLESINFAVLRDKTALINMATGTSAQKIRNIIFARPRWLIRVYRVLFTINCIIPIFAERHGSYFYPEDVFLFCIIAFWLDIIRFTWLAIVFLLLIFIVNYYHLFPYGLF